MTRRKDKLDNFKSIDTFKRVARKPNQSSSGAATRYDRFYPDIKIPKQLPALTEGQIYRFKPGIQYDFVSRWLQLSMESLKYFENEQRAVFCDRNQENPLEEIPTYKISSVKVLQSDHFEIYKNQSRKEQQKLYDFMFEIQLKCDYKDIWEERKLK